MTGMCSGRVGGWRGGGIEAGWRSIRAGRQAQALGSARPPPGEPTARARGPGPAPARLRTRPAISGVSAPSPPVRHAKQARFARIRAPAGRVCGRANARTGGRCCSRAPSCGCVCRRSLSARQRGLIYGLPVHGPDTDRQATGSARPSPGMAWTGDLLLREKGLLMSPRCLCARLVKRPAALFF